MTVVRFEVHAETDDNENAFVIGSPCFLGANSIDAALQLETSHKNYPWWSKDVDVGDSREFDFRVFLWADGKDARWESKMDAERRVVHVGGDSGEGVRIVTLRFGDAAALASEQVEVKIGDTGASVTSFLPRGVQRGLLPAMVVFPGGGYGEVVFEHEGRPYAEWLRSEGVAAFVVTYSVQPARHPTQLREARRAVRWVKRSASRLGVDPWRVGVMGSSAGAHLAGLVLTADRSGGEGSEDEAAQSEEWPWLPALGILCYPVVSMDLGVACAHGASRQNLLGGGGSCDERLCREVSLERRVSRWTPPVFIWHTCDDDVVPVGNAYLLASALGEAGVQHELHVYRHKGVCHGASLTGGGSKMLHWVSAAMRWLHEQGFFEA